MNACPRPAVETWGAYPGVYIAANLLSYWVKTRERTDCKSPDRLCSSQVQRLWACAFKQVSLTSNLFSTSSCCVTWGHHCTSLCLCFFISSLEGDSIYLRIVVKIKQIVNVEFSALCLTNIWWVPYAIGFVVNNILYSLLFLLYSFNPNPNVSHVSWKGEGTILQEYPTWLKDIYH